ncbi:fructose-bisphosphate aldolase (macronuclear) [Tetrahymena thermophila SB210]|uniref:fructose-bisphosphate aldolase n=1 Tax=Tetrahymena thermophila (strain SB210) TaxID=312017 RepID=I7M7A0_TETTS|nr:fructose-bisphosphate aldolase [Tetrahymena thermophila SB210]EAR90834.2 fructose-bisphosphate aldolase [Tetrahymena thermophila SB210]|eukprot:XP_001011079.2 fructose-bisphosphate aldolase [Tetrahymena thermophila SB210]
MELEFQSTINQSIQEFVCKKKGIINLGYILDSQRALKILENKQDLLKYLADMIIQNSDYSQFYNTIILNYEQFSESITDKRFKSIEDKSYENFLSRYEIKGVNFKEGCDIQEILDNRFVYNYELICFKADIQILGQSHEKECQDENVSQKYLEQQNKLKKIGEYIKEFNNQQSDLIFLIDFNITQDNESKTKKTRETMHQLEQQLYSFCVENLLKNEIPLQNMIISLNLPLIGQKNIKQATNWVEESAFNSLIMLSHALPACIGGVAITYDGVIEVNTFSKYLNEMNRLSAIKYFPITYMTHQSNFEYLALKWKGQDINYISTSNYFYRYSESLESGLHGNYKYQLEDLVFGAIEIGDIS